ncbi:MAG: nuclear transport factor 2 family protein [Myxococcota bacterium]
MDDRWARLGDECAIRDVLARYWRGIDRRDPELVRAAYHPDAFDDHGYYKGPVAGFVETLRPGVWAHFANTQHFAGNLLVEWVSADRARVESYAEAHHIRKAEPLGGAADATAPGAAQPGDRDYVYGLRYLDDFERCDGEWRIARRVCAWDWHRIDAVGGIPLPATYFRGHHSQDDPACRFASESTSAGGRRVEPDVLVAKHRCRQALQRYARGVDRCAPELVRSAYHPDAFDDHGGYQGDVDGFITWLKPTVLDAWDCTMHKLGNCLIEIGADGRHAFAETYAIAHHVGRLPGEARGPEADATSDLVMGVRYLDRLEDRGDGWKIAHRQMSFEWERIVPIGSQRAYPGFLRGQRDGSDPVLVAVPRSLPGSGAEAAACGGLEQEIADRAEIERQLLRYCRGVDRRDLERVRSTYHPDAFDDHGTYKGDVDGFLAFVAGEVHARFRTTMHKLGQSLIEVDGDVARAESYAVCHHVVAEAVPEKAIPETPIEAASGGAGAPRRDDLARSGRAGVAGFAPGVVERDVADLVMGIRYVDRFERRAGLWRIARRELRWEWVRTDRLESLDPGWTAGRSDGSDPVYV